METHCRPTKTDGPRESHHEGETLQPAHREGLLLLNSLFNSLQWFASSASMNGPEVKAFLEHLALRRHVAAATQH